MIFDDPAIKSAFVDIHERLLKIEGLLAPHLSQKSAEVPVEVSNHRAKVLQLLGHWETCLGSDRNQYLAAALLYMALEIGS